MTLLVMWCVCALIVRIIMPNQIIITIIIIIITIIPNI
jgi:hypothetical protein